MKTPRDILMTRHQAVAPKLDDIRHGIVGKLPKQEPKNEGSAHGLLASLLGFPSKLWLELILPCRRIWLGFATAWVLLFIINLAQRDRSEPRVAQAPPPTGMMMAYRDQQKMLDELLTERPLPAAENRLKNSAPRPRSEIIETIAI